MTGQRVRLGSLFDRKSPGDMAKRPCRLACIRGQLAGHVFAVSSCQSALGDGELHPSKNSAGRMAGQRVRLGSLFDRKSPGDMAKRPCRLACIRGKLAGHAFAVSPCQSALGDGELHPLKKCCREDDGTACPPRLPLRQEVPRRYGETAMSFCLHQRGIGGSCLRRISLPKRAGGRRTTSLKKLCREDGGTACPPRLPLRQEVPRRYGETAMSSCLHQRGIGGSCLRRISLSKRAGGGVGGTGGGEPPPARGEGVPRPP